MSCGWYALMCHSSILSCTLLLPLDSNLFSSAMLHKQQLCSAAFGICSALCYPPLFFFCIKTGLLFAAFMYLPPLMTKWNKDSFVSTLHFPVAIKPDNIRTHGEGMRWGFSEPISDCTVWICVYCNDCTCPANCWNTVFPVEPRQLWTEPCSVSHYISISSSKIRFRLSVEQESDFLIKRIQSWILM